MEGHVYLHYKNPTKVCSSSTKSSSIIFALTHSLTVTTELHVIYWYFRVEPGKEPAVLSNVWCTGTETSLLGCTSYGWRYVNQPNCRDHVGVYCWKDGKSPQFI